MNQPRLLVRTTCVKFSQDAKVTKAFEQTVLSRPVSTRYLYVLVMESYIIALVYRSPCVGATQCTSIVVVVVVVVVVERTD